MINGNLLCTNFDIAVESGSVPNVSTPTNPEPHDEPATFLQVFMKPLGTETRLLSITVPMTPQAVLNVAAELYEKLDDEHKAAFQAAIHAGLVLAKPGDERKHAAAAFQK